MPKPKEDKITGKMSEKEKEKESKSKKNDKQRDSILDKTDKRKGIKKRGRDVGDSGEDETVTDDELFESVRIKPDASLQSGKNREKKNKVVDKIQQDNNVVPKKTKSRVYYVIIFLAIPLFGAIGCLHFLAPSPPQDTIMRFRSGLDQLFQDFKNQSPRSAKKLRSRVLPYLNHTTSPQPFVLLVAAMQEDRHAADCFADRVGKLIVPKPVIINGSLYSDVKSDQAKQEIDNQLREAFRKGDFPTAAIIHNLESIPYSTSELFYAYCDHDNPRYKEATIIFTVMLPQSYNFMSSSSDEVTKEGMVETYLSKDSLWAKDDKFDENVMGALLSRITDTVIVLSGESKESLATLC